MLNFGYFPPAQHFTSQLVGGGGGMIQDLCLQVPIHDFLAPLHATRYVVTWSTYTIIHSFTDISTSSYYNTDNGTLCHIPVLVNIKSLRAALELQESIHVSVARMRLRVWLTAQDVKVELDHAGSIAQPVQWNTFWYHSSFLRHKNLVLETQIPPGKWCLMLLIYGSSFLWQQSLMAVESNLH